MIVTIHYNGDYVDTLIFGCSDMEQAKEIAHEECKSRGWEEKYCWSEVE